MYDVVTIGSATRDIIIRTRGGKIIANRKDPLIRRLLGFEYGAKIPVLQTYDTFGGGGCNVAIGLSRLGLRVAARVNVGQDIEGIRIKKILTREKVSSHLLSWDKKEKTDISVVVVHEKGEGDHIIFVDKNASENLALGRKEFSAHWVYIASLAGKWQKLLQDVVDLAQRKQIKLVFNPGSLQLAAGYEGLQKIWKNLAILIVSLDEATELVLGKKKNASLAPEELSQEIFSWGPKVVVITLGAKGAAVCDGERCYWKAAVKVPRVLDTTGAGDAFSAGFLGAYILGKDLDTALTWGVKNGASVICQYGAQTGLLKRKEIDK